ncbi:cupin domain-containing protein [Ruegeria sp. Alg231-54]|uniref:(R)-mandelonitrile lyase n=1 Tax=Ruegeria sp. Alg231-54 TaxID=1922221 RepID=UPI000D55DA2D|nr:cupin domain-containing protein [Ruegeria sp. Alg231-54]
MQIHRAGDRPSQFPGNEYFTGTVRFDSVVTGNDPSPVKILTVTFEPCARTAWHTHPAGQTLYVLSGLGLAGSEGQPVQLLRPGDTVWFAPGERHWHGASPDCAMTHLAVQTSVEGKTADWMEHVSDGDYSATRAE